MRGLFTGLAAACAVACGSEGTTTPPVRDAGDAGVYLVDVGPPRVPNVDLALTERAPLALATVALPAGAVPSAPWMGPEGEGVVVLRDGRFLAVEQDGAVRELERAPGETRDPGDGPPEAVVERASGEPLALVPTGGLVLRDGWVRRAELPALVRGAKGMTRWGGESLWITPSGLYTTQGAGWLRVDARGGAVTDAVSVTEGFSTETAREAWVLRARGVLERVVVEPLGASLSVTWVAGLRGVELGEARAVARWRDAVYVSRPTDLLRVDASGSTARLRIPGKGSGPVAMAPSGPWLWLLWEEGDLARLGAEGVEVVARGLAAEAPRLSVDPARGDAALVLSGSTLTRVVMEPVVGLHGFPSGATVTEPRLALRVTPPLAGEVASVEFRLDGATLSRLTAPPWGWGAGGAPWRDLPSLEFGEHTVGVAVRYRNAPELQRTRAFRYASPLGRVPTYDRDVRPVYAARCARCHSTGVARDLRTYEQLSSQAPLIAEVVQSRRMPPDLEIDATTAQIFTAWVAGGAPR